LQSGEWDSSFNLIFSQQFWIQRQCLLKAGHMRASWSSTRQSRTFRENLWHLIFVKIIQSANLFPPAIKLTAFICKLGPLNRIFLNTSRISSILRRCPLSCISWGKGIRTNTTTPIWRVEQPAVVSLTSPHVQFLWSSVTSCVEISFVSKMANQRTASLKRCTRIGPFWTQMRWNVDVRLLYNQWFVPKPKVPILISC
jgi:hypothetical protein